MNNRIPEEIISRLSALPISDVIAHFTGSPVPPGDTTIRCPLHPDDTPSFHITPAKNLFHCFGCQRSGGPIQFVMHHQGLDWLSAVKALADYAGTPIQDLARGITQETEQQQADYLRLTSACERVAEFAHQLLLSPAGDPLAAAALVYAQQRLGDPSRPDSPAARQRIGTLPYDLLKVLPEIQVTEADARTLGLIRDTKPNRSGHSRPYCPLGGRLIFPICTPAGRTVGFSGRLVSNRPGAPKYINTPETPIFKKGNLLYLFHLAAPPARSADRLYITEGYMDAIHLHALGITNTVACMGTAFTEKQAQLALSVTKHCTIIPDGDPAGFTAAQRTAFTLADLGAEVTILPLESSSEDPEPDPASFFTSKTHFFAYERTHALPLPLFSLKQAVESQDADRISRTATQIARRARTLDPEPRILLIGKQ